MSENTNELVSDYLKSGGRVTHIPPAKGTEYDQNSDHDHIIYEGKLVSLETRLHKNRQARDTVYTFEINGIEKRCFGTKALLKTIRLGEAYEIALGPKLTRRSGHNISLGSAKPVDHHVREIRILAP